MATTQEKLKGLLSQIANQDNLLGQELQDRGSSAAWEEEGINIMRGWRVIRVIRNLLRKIMARRR